MRALSAIDKQGVFVGAVLFTLWFLPAVGLALFTGYVDLLVGGVGAIVVLSLMAGLFWLAEWLFPSTEDRS